MNYCHHSWCVGDKSYHKALLIMFSCDGISDHASWNEVFHYRDTNLSRWSIIFWGELKCFQSPFYQKMVTDFSSIAGVLKNPISNLQSSCKLWSVPDITKGVPESKSFLNERSWADSLSGKGGYLQGMCNEWYLWWRWGSICKHYEHEISDRTATHARTHALTDNRQILSLASSFARQ